MKKYGAVSAGKKIGDWEAGSATGITYSEVVKTGNHSPFLPTDERQSFRNIDTMACVIYTNFNTIETQIIRMIEMGIIKVELIKDWLDYNKKFNGADRFIAKASGTSRSGNSMTKVADTIRKLYFPPEKDWPPPKEPFSWDEYYKSIPQSVYELAKILSKYFEFKREWVGVSRTQLCKHLKQAPLQICIATCPGWKNSSIVKRCSSRHNHIVLLYNMVWGSHLEILDHYPPYRKKLAWDYKVYHAMKFLVIPKKIILKNTSMKLFKFNKVPKGYSYRTIFVLDNKGLYRPIADEAFALTLLGENWQEIDPMVKQMEEITKGMIGDKIGTIPRFGNSIINFINTIKN